jgi:hypothetical protein
MEKAFEFAFTDKLELVGASDYRLDNQFIDDGKTKCLQEYYKDRHNPSLEIEHSNRIFVFV